MPRRHTIEEIHGDTPVCSITITMARSGACRVEGAITDHAFATFLLDTARDVVNNYHSRAKLSDGKAIVVPAYDTALVGTPEEKLLLAARDELDDAMVKR